MVEFNFILEDDEAENLMDILRDEQHHCQNESKHYPSQGESLGMVTEGERKWFRERAKYIKALADKIVNSSKKF